MIIKIENNKPVGYPLQESNIKQIFPEVAFPAVLFPSDVEPYGYGMYDFSQQPTNLQRYEKLVEGEPVKDEKGYWRQTWQIVAQSAEEKIETDAKKASEIRFERNRKLALSDWSQLPDAPITQEKRTLYTIYRQALRDVPSQLGFPWDIVWPTLNN